MTVSQCAQPSKSRQLEEWASCWSGCSLKVRIGSVSQSMERYSDPSWPRLPNSVAPVLCFRVDVLCFRLLGVICSFPSSFEASVALCRLFSSATIYWCLPLFGTTTAVASPVRKSAAVRIVHCPVKCCRLEWLSRPFDFTQYSHHDLYSKCVCEGCWLASLAALWTN